MILLDGLGITIRESAPELDLEGIFLENLRMLLEDLELRLVKLEDSEPEDDGSDEYELRDDAVNDLGDYMDQSEEAIAAYELSDTD